MNGETGRPIDYYRDDLSCMIVEMAYTCMHGQSQTKAAFANLALPGVGYMEMNKFKGGRCWGRVHVRMD